MSAECEEKIKQLIGDVDSVKNDIMDYLHRGIPDILIIGLILLVIFWVHSVSQTEFSINLMIVSGAFIISLLVFYDRIYPKWDKVYAEYKAEKMCKSLSQEKEETKVLLTALIIMKTKQPKIKLSTVYKLEPSIFTKESLIKLLY